MGLSRPEYWSGEPCPSPGHLPNPGLPHRRRILHQLSHHGSPCVYPHIAKGNRHAYICICEYVCAYIHVYVYMCVCISNGNRQRSKKQQGKSKLPLAMENFPNGDALKGQNIHL